MSKDNRIRSREHRMAETWDEGRMVSWCSGCGQRPWPCDTALEREARAGAEAELLALTGQRDRLRAALSSIERKSAVHMGEHRLIDICRTARAALTGGPEGET